MLQDIQTMIWKEMRELMLQQGRFRGGRLGMMLFVAVFGIFLPLQTGPAWVESPVSLVYWAWVPFLLVSSVVADAFAGERERHTLETLLASRLSDRAILLGKVGAAMLYGWGLTMISVVLSLITLNVVFRDQGLLFYSLPVSGAILAITLLVATLAAALGVLVSLRASTVRQAQQTFSIAFYLVFVPMFFFPMLPADLRLRISLALMQMDISLVAILAGLVLLAVDLVLLWLGFKRFQRARLILD